MRKKSQHRAQQEMIEDQLKAKEILEKFSAAQARRTPWETHWKQAYDYTIPQRSVFSGGFGAGGSRVDSLFDATAADASEYVTKKEITDDSRKC